MALIGLVFLLPSVVGAQDKVTFAYDWLTYGKMAPWHAARVEGFYKAENLEVSLVRGFGSMDTIKRVGAGQVEFGMGTLTDTIESRIRGIPVKSVYIIFHNTPAVVMFIKGKGIEKPKDLEGKTVGGPLPTDSWVLFPIFAKAQGIDMSKVKHINMTSADTFVALPGGVVDSIHSWTTVRPGVLRNMGLKGMGPEKLGMFKYFEGGVEIYSQDVVVPEDLPAKKPDLVRRFVRATARAKVWSIENPEKALEDFWKENPTLKATSEETNRDELRVTIELFKDKYTDQYGQGFPVREKVIQTQEIYTSAKNLTKEPVDKIYTDEFLKGMPREYMFPKQWVKF
jgi:NitT/TauT family transport system substrate-binding protein